MDERGTSNDLANRHVPLVHGTVGLAARGAPATATVAVAPDEKRPEIIEHRRKDSKGESVLVKRYIKGRLLGKVLMHSAASQSTRQAAVSTS